ncbi:Aristolochene synthase [Colletotrichum siamense]|nr:Aristolochene synthase [Colletotrichum siamense]
MTPSAQAQESRSGLGRVGQLLKNFNGVYKLDGVRSPVYTCLSTQKRQRRRRTIPLSAWAPICHPLVDPVTVEVDAWFLDSWPFPDDKARQKFIAAEFSRVTCLYFPLAKNDSIAFACRLLAILFLIDDVLEYMSLEEGESYNEKLTPLARGNAQPNRKCLVSLNVGTVTVKPSVLCTRSLTLRLQGIVPVEAMFYDLWASMREKDRRLADQVLEPTFIFMRARTEKIRTEITEIGRYLQYRERDVGKA